MKRMLLAAATSSMCALAIPGLASAAAHHHSSCRHRGHHACLHSHHAQRARVMTFGAASTSTGTGTGTTAAGSTPSSPTTPTSGETAGTVASFTGGVLTITLTDGSTVSGKVTEETEIRCQSATPPAEGSDDDQQGDESDGGSGGDGSSQSGPVIGSRGDDMSSGDGGEDGTEQQSCTTASLTPGAVVREAELSVSSAGSVWDHVDLIQ